MRPLPALAGALLILAGLLPAAGAPLFTHSDDGPIVVRRGDSGARVPLAGAAPEVRELVARANDLLAAGPAAAAEAIQRTLAEARELAAAEGRSLAGALYLEETVRRLHRLQLARVPIATSDFVAAHKDNADLGKPIVLQRAGPALGADLRTLGACLELAPFPDDPGPRTVHLEPGGALWARVGGRPLAFDLVAYGKGRLFLRSVTLGASRSFAAEAKAGLARMVLARCRTGATR